MFESLNDISGCETAAVLLTDEKGYLELYINSEALSYIQNSNVKDFTLCTSLRDLDYHSDCNINLRRTINSMLESRKGFTCDHAVMETLIDYLRDTCGIRIHRCSKVRNRTAYSIPI